MGKKEEAQDLIRRARAMGCEPKLEGHWVVWRPPLPAEMLLDTMRVSNEIAAELKAENAE